MIKADLRKIYLAEQKSISNEARAEKSSAISARLFRHFDFRRISFLHCFLPIEKFNEINTKAIFGKIWQEFPGVETVVPRVDFPHLEMKSLIYKNNTKLVKNAWDIHEPLPAELIETAKIDAVLIPLLCFDAQGFRVGYGKGFYDRFLRNCRADCLKIGLSYFAPVEKIADASDFDVKLNYCITPFEFFEFDKNQSQKI